MKKVYIRPKSEIFKVEGKEFVLRTFNEDIPSVVTDDFFGKDRGNAQDDNSSSGKEDWGYHRSMWD